MQLSIRRGDNFIIIIIIHLNWPARQAGQSSRLHTTISDRSSMKYFFNFESNTEVLRVNFNCSSGKICQIFGKSYSGSKSRLARVVPIIWNWSALRNWISFSPIFLIAFLTQTSSNDSGRNFCVKRCMNCNLLKVMRSGSGKIWSFLKSGSVWELCFAPATILIAFFCILKSSPMAPGREQDQIWIAYSKWQWKIEL